jgi:hypothetical protein
MLKPQIEEQRKLKIKEDIVKILLAKVKIGIMKMVDGKILIKIEVMMEMELDQKVVNIIK